MALKDSTKILLARTLESMLETTPFDKIRVTQLCRLADVKPRVFYYHFENLNDLGAWIFEWDFRLGHDGTSVADRTSRDLFVSVIEKQLEGMWAKRKLYQKLYKDSSQGNLMTYTIKRNVAEEEYSMKYALGVSQLSARLRSNIQFASYGTVGLIVDWLNEESDFTPHSLAAYLYDANALLLGEKHL